MANGTTRLAQAEMVAKGKNGGAEHEEMKKISDSGKLPKQPLKASKSEHNHSGK